MSAMQWCRYAFGLGRGVIGKITLFWFPIEFLFVWCPDNRVKLCKMLQLSSFEIYPGIMCRDTFLATVINQSWNKTGVRGFSKKLHFTLSRLFYFWGWGSTIFVFCLDTCASTVYPVVRPHYRVFVPQMATRLPLYIPAQVYALPPYSNNLSLVWMKWVGFRNKLDRNQFSFMAI